MIAWEAEEYRLTETDHGAATHTSLAADQPIVDLGSDSNHNRPETRPPVAAGRPENLVIQQFSPTRGLWPEDAQQPTTQIGTFPHCARVTAPSREGQASRDRSDTHTNNEAGSRGRIGPALGRPALV